MASLSHRLLLSLSVLLGLLAIAVNARPGRQFHPCNTLIFFSASSYSLHQNPNPNPNPNSIPSFSTQDRSSSSSSFSGRPSLTFFFTEIRQIQRRPSLPSYETIVVDRADKEPMPFGLYSSVNSARDRTRDVLSAAGALLFGVGCGVLTAATMYLLWSLFAPNSFEFRDSDDESDTDESDDLSAKKLGYVSIPADHPPPPAKEVV